MGDDIARWSEELARDPGSGVFIPLADALRRRGELDLAMKVATRGLTRRPYDGDAHDLLARIWADRGDVERAMDEWSMALQCAPGHAGALKGMGFACHQAGQVADAERYLIQAAAADPEDGTIPAALTRVRAHHQRTPDAPTGVPFRDQMVRPPPDPPKATTTDGSAPTPERVLHLAPEVETPPLAQGRHADTTDGIESPTLDSHQPLMQAAVDVETGSPTDSPPADSPPADSPPADSPTAAPLEQEGEARSESSDPPVQGVDASSAMSDARFLFAELLGGGEQAALVVDGQGLVLAGCYVIADGRDVAQEVGAALSGVSDEARRAMRHLDLGAWSSLLFETEEATVAIGPLPALSDAAVAGAAVDGNPVHDGIAVVAAGPTVPLGLVRRLLTRVLTRAAAWLHDPLIGTAS